MARTALHAFCDLLQTQILFKTKTEDRKHWGGWHTVTGHIFYGNHFMLELLFFKKHPRIIQIQCTPFNCTGKSIYKLVYLHSYTNILTAVYHTLFSFSSIHFQTYMLPFKVNKQKHYCCISVTVLRSTKMSCKSNSRFRISPANEDGISHKFSITLAYIQSYCCCIICTSSSWS